MSVNILKFIKDDQGSVRVYKIADNTLLASLNPASNIIKDRSQKDFFIIQNENGENPFVLSYLEISKSLCEPEIYAENFNEFLIELADKFFYTSEGSSSSIPSPLAVNVINFDPYLHKYKNPYLCDASYYEPTYNPFIVRLSMIFDTSINADSYKVINNDSFNNRSMHQFSNLSYPATRTYDFYTFFRFMDMYIKFAPRPNNLAIVGTGKRITVEIFLDVRTNEFFIAHHHTNLPPLQAPNFEMPKLKQDVASPAENGIEINLPEYYLTIMFESPSQVS
ncbi:hypothetical protein [Flavobacterium pectinovorum]|uniref:Uncharacterized protein n=1 Tax=Flavobacterium pectinovorum TaxID=29533 RepID=A0A502F6E6_9FLAO|nr:hypothetical protein [Flavobacterium pectinovorum]TPG44381.1 hypothetical protein EAH81_02585 [Flavobacterium pectinovorum]